MGKIRWSIFWALLLSFTMPIDSYSQPSPSPSPGEQSSSTESLSKVIWNNIPGILLGFAGILTAVYSRKKSEIEINGKIGLKDIENQDELRRRLLEALSKDKGEFLDVIRKLGGFVTNKDLENEFQNCSDRFAVILRDPKMERFVEDMCPFVTRKHLEKFDLPISKANGYSNFAHIMEFSLFEDPSGRRLLDHIAMEALEYIERKNYPKDRVIAVVEDAKIVSRMDVN